MGMHIGSSYASMGAQSMSGTSIWQQRQQNMGALKSALQTGDLASAQSAYANITGNMPNIDPNSPLGQIGQALQTGDIASATKISSTWKSHARVEGSKEQAYASNAANDPSSSFAAALINSLTQTGLISASSAVTPTSASASGANSSSASSVSAATAPSSLDPAIAQSLSTFMQNLFATLQAQAGAQPSTLSPTTPSSAQGVAAVTSNTGTSATQVAAQTNATSSGISTPANATGAPANGPVRHGHHGGHHHYTEGSSSSQLSANLQTLISQLSSASSSSTTGSTDTSAVGTSPSASTDALAQLEQSFTNLTNTAGSAGGNTLTSFLQNLSQNLQSMGTSGSLLNVSA